MYIERLLQINMATLAALGALLLGMGQRSEGTPLLVVAAAVASVWLTDVKHWFHLGRWASNGLMLLAALVCLREVFPLGSEVQALSLARLLVYLQIILLFQKKDARTYGMLMMLSLLQVIVATLFSQGVWFGVLLVTYMLLGFLAMTLLLLHRQWELYGPSGRGAQTTSRCWSKQLARLSDEGRPARPASPHRWPLAGQHAEFTSMPGGSARAAICDALVGRLGRMSLHTLALTFVLFFAVPRFDQLAWRGSIAGPQSIVGFNDSVTLGELGQAIESRDEVMRVQFFKHLTDEPYPVHGEIYLQGALLTTYSRGHWNIGGAMLNVGTEELQRAPHPPLDELVRQEAVIEGLDRGELFFVAPYVPLYSTSEINVDHTRRRLIRSDHLCTRRYHYRLGTTALVRNKQVPLVPAEERDLQDPPLQMPGDDGPDALPNLVALANRWIEQSGLPAKDRAGRARYIEQQLASSGQFTYSLAGQPRDPALDPIEDFVTKHPEGHCEYFAAALTLMLRSQNIPARVVVGYKCDEWNSLGGYYQVRQLHAHAWVEAYLRPSQVPPELVHGKNYWPWKDRGAWLQLDPTPTVDSGMKNLGWLGQSARWLDSAWSNYIVELNCERQRNAIYQPIVHAFRAVAQRVGNAAWWWAVLDSGLKALRTSGVAGALAWIFLVVASAAALALLAFGGRLAWRLSRRLRIRFGGNRSGAARNHRAAIEFYRRFEHLAARQGMIRPLGQTQREFAAAVAAHFAADAGQSQLAPLPNLIAEAFYRVRFGGRPLDNAQAQAVECAIAQLAARRRS